MLPDMTDSKREQAEDVLGQGLDLLDEGQEEQAGRCFFESIEIDPTYADGYVHLGNVAWRKGEGPAPQKVSQFVCQTGENEKGGNQWSGRDSNRSKSSANCVRSR
jgi:hypothetical protein